MRGAKHSQFRLLILENPFDILYVGIVKAASSWAFKGMYFEPPVLLPRGEFIMLMRKVRP